MAIKHRIDEIYTHWPFYGVRRMTAQLRREGVLINHKAVERHMREMGLRGLAPGPQLGNPAVGHTVYPYLLRGLQIEGPNHVWGIEEVYLNDYASPREARCRLGHYLTFYNHERVHQALGYQTPADVYYQTGGKAPLKRVDSVS